MTCKTCGALAADAAAYRRALRFVLEHKITTNLDGERLWLKQHTTVSQMRVPDELMPVLTSILQEIELGAVSAR